MERLRSEEDTPAVLRVSSLLSLMGLITEGKLCVPVLIRWHSCHGAKVLRHLTPSVPSSKSC